MIHIAGTLRDNDNKLKVIEILQKYTVNIIIINASNEMSNIIKSKLIIYSLIHYFRIVLFLVLFFSR